MWNLLILDPMVNILIWLYGLLGHNYVLAILVFTFLVRLIIFPLTWQQQKSMAAMQEIQPQLKKLQEKHKNDPETLQRKTMELYREKGVNPLGGCLPSVIQFPILIGLYQAITRSLAASPVQLLELSQHLYNPLPAALSWLPNATALIPLDSRFLWLDLAAPDPLPVLPILVVVTTFLQQKLLTPPSTDPQQATMSRTMQLTMPLFIGYISLTFPSGLSIYWILSNIIGTLQYVLLGRASLKNLFGTEDGSFSLSGFLGLPQAEPDPKSRSGRRDRK
ncbi:MAG TPA: membrane protein insertase YidC [Chloroflexi bacterium]|nr:membrane protein insertase YidC [Chloroflexota bacterium]